MTTLNWSLPIYCSFYFTVSKNASKSGKYKCKVGKSARDEMGTGSDGGWGYHHSCVFVVCSTYIYIYMLNGIPFSRAKCINVCANVVHVVYIRSNRTLGWNYGALTLTFFWIMPVKLMQQFSRVPMNERKSIHCIRWWRHLPDGRKGSRRLIGVIRTFYKIPFIWFQCDGGHAQ